MKHYRRQRKLAGAAVTLMSLVMFLGLTGDSHTQPQQIRKWHPTRVPEGAQFVGHEACAECHAGKVRSQEQTTMGRALEPVADAVVLKAKQRMTYTSGKYSYEITRDGDRSWFTVSDGSNKVSAAIAYTFGQGLAGQTYVLRYKDRFYESRLSYYEEIQGLDITIGQMPITSDSLTDALGRPMSEDETLQCFSCHSTNAVKGRELHLDKLTPGIRCEICHGPGGEHVAAGRAGEPNKDKIFNPGRLSGDDLTQEFCASCHRGVEDVIILPQQGGLNNVRFQPYRIFNSRCYADDKRISCTACHDPHKPLVTEAAYYDAKCTACHQAKSEKIQTEKQAPACKAAKAQDCVACHMPKVELPGAHFRFTDHRIRIVKPGEAYPR